MSLQAVKDFIAKAKEDPLLRAQLAECSLDQWGDAHTPLDIDHGKVIQIAQGAGYKISLADIIAAQCEQLDKFWTFEMNNSFVARRCIAKIQIHISAGGRCPEYYGY